MKLKYLTLALFAISPISVLHARVTITPVMTGYNMQDTQANNGHDHLLESDQGHFKDDVMVGASLGVELTPWLNFEAEYTHLKGDLDSNLAADAQYTQQQINGNFLVTSDLITKNYDSRFKPYVLLGAGHYKYKYEGDYAEDTQLKSSEGTLANTGIGAFWRISEVLSLRTEARATYNIDDDFWNYTALAGLNVVIGGHLKPMKDTPKLDYIESKAPVIDTVSKQLVEPLDMELRVFFDTNKTVIKPQYQTEIAKVAEKLNEYSNATATIEGHTDSTGPRKLNERLSLARANAVKSVLVNEYNIDSARMNTIGYAWDQPIADNNSKEGRAMNRRVFAKITGSRVVLRK